MSLTMEIHSVQPASCLCMSLCSVLKTVLPVNESQTKAAFFIARANKSVVFSTLDSQEVLPGE